MALTTQEKKILKELVRDQAEKFKRNLISETTEISDFVDMKETSLRTKLQAFAQEKITELQAERQRKLASAQRLNAKITFLQSYLG